MILGELIECGLIKDEHKICLQVHLTRKELASEIWHSGTNEYSGNWKIESIRFEHGYLWTVTVKTEE